MPAGAIAHLGMDQGRTVDKSAEGGMRGVQKIMDHACALGYVALRVLEFPGLRPDDNTHFLGDALKILSGTARSAYLLDIERELDSSGHANITLALGSKHSAEYRSVAYEELLYRARELLRLRCSSANQRKRPRPVEVSSDDE